MSNNAKLIMSAFGRAANGFSYDDVVDATTNLLVNLLRQKHLTLAAANEQLDGIAADAKHLLRTHHYEPNGVRKNTLILHPLQFPELAAHDGVLQ